MKLKILTALAALIVGTAHAGVSTSLLQSAPVKEPGQYEAKAHLDFIARSETTTFPKSGVLFTPHLQFGLLEHYLDMDAYIGTGVTDFQAGTTLKYNLLPDIENQAALSFLAGVGVLYDQVGYENIVSGLITTGAIVSKQFNVVEFGSWSPYAALQIEVLTNKIESVLPVNLAIGSQLHVAETAPWNYYGEISLSLRRSFFSLSLGAGYPF